MKRIEVRLSVSVVAPLLDVIREMAEELKLSLAAAQHLDEIDEAIRHLWFEDLLASQNRDLATLLALFDEEFLKEGAIELDEENAELIIRACAAVRLRLRARELPEINEESMESGNVAVDDLPENTRKAFVCYLFLATLQELIIQHLDLASPSA
jgi:hypothetical protein|uniref:DUF2017 family protein n=1 Tax=Cephaloticoccus sp. TaxID=1985742 RepID=UPI00404B8476